MDKKFTDKIKDVLNNPPDLPFDEKAWKNMEGRLYGQPKLRGAALYYLIPLALLLWSVPMLFAWFAYQKFDEATAKIEHLQTQLLAKTPVLSDTVFTRYETVVYDTIFKSAHITEKIAATTTEKQPQHLFNYPYFNKNNHPYLFSSNNNQSPFSQNNPVQNNPWISFFETQNNSNGQHAEAIDMQLEEQKDLAKINMLGIKPFQYEYLPGPPIDNPNYIVKKSKKNLRYYMYKMQPTDFALAAHYGTLKLPWFGLNATGDYTVDIEAEIGYGKNWKMTIGAEYLQWGFDGRFIDDGVMVDNEKIFEDFPEVQLESPEDNIKEIQGDFKYIQIPVGLKYYLSNSSKLKPSIGFGFSARRALRSDLEYEVKKQPFGEDKIILNNQLPNTFQLKSLWGSIGLNYGLDDYWIIHLSGTGNFDINGTYKYEKLKMLNFKAGLKYKF